MIYICHQRPPFLVTIRLEQLYCNKKGAFFGITFDAHPHSGWFICLERFAFETGLIALQLKNPQRITLRIFTHKLNGTVYFIRSDASCAYVCSSNCSVFISNSYSLNVSVPFSSCMSYGMGYAVSRYLTFSANFAFS